MKPLPATWSIPALNVHGQGQALDPGVRQMLDEQYPRRQAGDDREAEGP
jgi:hypothetical protein